MFFIAPNLPLTGPKFSLKASNLLLTLMEIWMLNDNLGLC